MSFLRPLALAALVAACSTPEGVDPVDPPGALPILPQALADREFPTGSTALVAHDGFVWNVNTDAGSVTRTDANTGASLEIPLGEEPTRIAAHGDRIFVTLRGERALAIVDANAPTEPARVVHVGAEPYGVVVRQDGLALYVAVSQADEVLELDGSTYEVRRRFSVQGEPKFLALHPSGASLYVGSARGEARLTAIDLRTGEDRRLDLPQTRRFTMDGEVALVPRLTGDLWVSPGGSSLIAPTLYADTVTPIREVEPGEVIEPEPGVEGYGGTGDGVDKFTPAITEITVGPVGQSSGGARAVFVSTTIFAEENNFMGTNLGSYLTSASVAPNGQWLATMEASRTVFLIDPYAPVMGNMMFDAAMPMPPGEDGFAPGPFTAPEDGGFEAVAMAPIVAGAGVNAAVFADGQVWTHNAFDDSIDRIATSDLSVAGSILEQNTAMMMNAAGFAPRGARIPVSQSPLSAQIREGRALFFSATDSAMGQGGISCSTCHVEGRNDGITWTFESGVRQTPSLAGAVSETAPVTWTSEVASVALEADLTSRGRMGGQGLAPAQLDAIAAFVDWTREVDVAQKGSTAPDVLRGKAIFERSDVGCASCHSGARFTDNQGHAIRGVVGLNTPSLTGVSATGPYLHDGTLPNLRAVLEWARGGQMGDTSMLSDAEMDDLEAYLRSL